MLSKPLVGAPSQEHWHEALLSSYLLSGAHQFSAVKSHVIFLATSHKKDEFEEFLCYSYTLLLLCDGPKQEDRAKPRFMYRKRVLVTPGIGASTSHAKSDK
jgi:hypothetical protein